MSPTIIEQVREVLGIEAQAIVDLMDRVGLEFEKAVRMILESKGRVILTGIGKSGLVGRKISATLNSTGTPSLFLHPVEAIHGDLGMVTSDDILIVISNSGQTMEINNIIHMIKDIGARIIAFTGNTDSPMALESDVVIDVGVKREACPMGLAPTASTTAALAMGDALAVVLINARRFNSKDFMRYHPGGSLGERLSTKVREVMFTGDKVPRVPLGSSVKLALREIDSKGIGATLVVDRQNRLQGIITDGDVRRALLKTKNILDMKVESIMSDSPRTIDEQQTAAEALGIMELYEITHLCIIDINKKVKGIVHLHDLLGREEFRLNDRFRRSSGPHR
ncbi:MAG: KpsF/GutQ family sugar-phosphate isomerase [Deltaproteobacteria bacterium]|nr:KpsF/GutQ family sugar-phosphate isomerase [Deltaproteobacteria bacterium]